MSRFVDTRMTPQNLRALWDTIHKNADDLTAALATIQQQAQTIASLQSTQDTHQQQIQQALITAGKAVSQTAQGVPPAPGGGGGSGGGGGGGGGGNGDAHPNHADLVQQAKDDLTTAGEDLTGPCGAFKIIRRACQYIAPSDPTVGVLYKGSPTPNNCIFGGVGYAADIICYADGIIYDVLFDGGGANTVQWNFKGTVPVDQYRASP